MERISKLIYGLSTCLILLFSCNKDVIEEPLLPESEPESTPCLDPIKVEEIVLDYWQDKNHLQGITFAENTVFIACSKQLFEYDCNQQKVVQELKCTDFPGDYCRHSHYGDIAFDGQDLWNAFHHGNWLKEYSCAKNQLLRFLNSELNNLVHPEVYLLDYPGHIGAVEVIGNQVFVSGKYIAPDWTPEQGCHEEFMIYQYDISNLQDSSLLACNAHSQAFLIPGKGQDGVQVLAKKNKRHLLLAPYPCKNDDNISRVYEIDLLNDSSNPSIFLNKNWAYGLAYDAHQKLYFAKDNRNYRTITLVEHQ